MIAVACPICEALIEIDNPAQDAIVVCPECGEEWRVVELDPPQLAYAWDMEEEVAIDQDEDHPRGEPA